MICLQVKKLHATGPILAAKFTLFDLICGIAQPFLGLGIDHDVQISVYRCMRTVNAF
jgi:hypothetical protein